MPPAADPAQGLPSVVVALKPPPKTLPDPLAAAPAADQGDWVDAPPKLSFGAGAGAAAEDVAIKGTVGPEPNTDLVAPEPKILGAPEPMAPKGELEELLSLPNPEPMNLSAASGASFFGSFGLLVTVVC